MSTLRVLSSNTLRSIFETHHAVYLVCSRRSYSKRTVAGTHSPTFTHSSTSTNILTENDIVLLKHIHNSASTPILSTRLHIGKKIELQRDSIAHDDILGKRVRDLVSSKKRVNYRISEPTLAEYTDLSPRLVTPVSSLVDYYKHFSNHATVDLLPGCKFDCLPPRPSSSRSQSTPSRPRSRSTRDIRSWYRTWSIDLEPCKSHTQCKYSCTNNTRRTRGFRDSRRSI